jgi:glycosyltransferase involved in cell wall biosynthesis
LIYYPTEKFLANMTDIIITINKEDYERATLFNAKKVVYIPGVGIDTKAILNITIDPSQKKKELGIAENTKIILSVGELIKRKNFETVVKAFAKADLSNTVLMICGHGCLEKKLRDIVKKLHIEHKVLFTGYRHDIYEIMKMSDIFFFPSYQEGLSVALMEAMAIGLPVICSKIRGNVDLIDHEKGGFLLSPTDIDGFACAMKKLISSPDLINEMKNYNMTKIKKFDVRYISESMSHIYS